MNASIELLKNFFNLKTNVELSKKIYVTREDSNYRKILNEGDVVTILRKNGYKVINPQLYEIDEQIEIFSNAEKIIAPHGSNLANIIFCNPGTKVYEIGPDSSHPYDKRLSKRYENLCSICNLNYHKFLCDSVDVKNHNQTSTKYIHHSMLKDSNFYKNMILKLSDVDLILKEIQHPTEE